MTVRTVCTSSVHGAWRTRLSLLAWLGILSMSLIDLLAFRAGWHFEVEAARMSEQGVGGLLLSVPIGIVGGVVGAIWRGRGLDLGTNVYGAVLGALLSSAVAVTGVLSPYLGLGALVWGLPNLLSFVGIVIGRTAAASQPTSALRGILGPLLGLTVFTVSPLAMTLSMLSAVPVVAGAIIGGLAWLVWGKSG